MARQRRSRFTFTLTGETTHRVILAPSASDVRYHFARQGKTVATIYKGDYRKQARQRKAAAAGTQFRVDPVALERAKALLGIKLPVHVRQHGRVGSTNGNHRFETTHHNVMLKRYRSAEEANETLWHELTHCSQAERVIASGGDWTTYSEDQNRRYSYSRRPIEVEARRTARQNRHITIVVPA